jgi:hypothetical protein
VVLLLKVRLRPRRDREMIVSSITRRGSHGERGTITAIWRYPIKSMIDQQADDSAVTEQALFGDGASVHPGQRHGRGRQESRPRRAGGAEAEYCVTR